MFEIFAPFDAENRERRWIHSRHAILQLTKFGIGTIVGYLVWELFLTHVSPDLLTLNTFFWMFLVQIAHRDDRRLLFLKSPLVSAQVPRYAVSLFAYWFAFWLGLAHSGAALALAFLALTMIVCPIMVRQYEPPHERASIARLSVVGILLVTAFACIKLDTDFASLNWGIFDRLRAGWISTICFLIAVVAEGYQDRRTAVLERVASTAEVGQMGPFFFGGDRVQASARLQQAVLVQSLAWCLIVSFLVFGIYSYFCLAPASLAPHTSWIWFGLWLFALGIVGSGAKMRFVVPLQLKRLDTQSIAPLIAGRQGIFLVMSLLVTGGIPYIAECEDKKCHLLGQIINLAIVPERNQTYWAGLTVVVAIWVLSWAWFVKFGFFKRRIET